MTSSDAERKLTLTQCLVGGLVGFGLLSALLCVMTGGNFAFWIVMTVFLTTAYTGYYYFRTRKRIDERD